MTDHFNQSRETQNNSTDENYRLVLPSKLIEDVHVYEGNPVKEKVLAVLGALAITGLVVIGSGIGYGNSKEEAVQKVSALATEVILESLPQPPETPNPYESLSLQAKAVVVYDVHREKYLYTKNESERLPLASLTKLMTGLLVSESLDHDSHVVVTQSALATEGDSGLYANESWKVKDLLNFTMFVSSNDGATALAGAVGGLWQSTPSISEEIKVQSFVDRMNFRADELGLDQTRFTNPTGLDVGDYGGMGTAEEMSKLLTHIWKHHPEAIRYTNESERVFVSLDELVHNARNTNQDVYNIPGLIGGKTGYTDHAGGNLVVIYDAGFDHPIVVVVLGSSIEGRFTDVQSLVEATYEYVASGWFEYDMLMTSGSTPMKM